MIHYLFGYGSLINQQSRKMTGRTGDAIPISVKGFQRGWNVLATELKFTGVGIIPSSIWSCNGVLVPIHEDELPLFDEREIIGSGYKYERRAIPVSQVDAASPLNSQTIIWTYIVTRPETPSIEYPIIQSYIDVILNGCLEFGRAFAETFVKNTVAWESPWINDRANPRYVRSLSGLDYKIIDEILTKNLPGGIRLRKEVAN